MSEARPRDEVNRGCGCGCLRNLTTLCGDQRGVGPGPPDVSFVPNAEYLLDACQLFRVLVSKKSGAADNIPEESIVGLFAAPQISSGELLGDYDDELRGETQQTAGRRKGPVLHSSTNALKDLDASAKVLTRSLDASDLLARVLPAFFGDRGIRTHVKKCPVRIQQLQTSAAQAVVLEQARVDSEAAAASASLATAQQMENIVDEVCSPNLGL
ncbi:hypothetical protein DFH09DRAFT_1079270 [Mycena vulgaris]|nr:hypothetical protein DFH09DRAFT_1079270 [Mycena vulgaris]